ncbi:MAG: holo-ACP synthase [Thermoanaerobaculia bacterium]
MSRILGLGLDIVDCNRVQGLLDRHGEAFLRRICRVGEPRVDSGPRRAAHVAGLFAAKEAAMKALGTGWSQGVGFLQIEILRRPTGAPELVLHGEARRRADAMGAENLWLSITHDGANAVAVVILEGSRS